MRKIIAAVALLFPASLIAHSGGIDNYGCHNQTSTNQYHCHSGSLAGSSFSSKEAMLVQLNSGSPPVTPTTPTPPTSPTTPSAIYNRDDYLTGWADVDGDCQDARQEVLIQESIVPVVLSSNGCQVTMGLWRDPYTALTFTNPSDLDIDHLVPLKEAHDSGAWLWSADAKRAYANNITNPLVLIAVDDNTNQSKGDRDPAGWLPPNVSYRCDYAKSWVAVKQTYGLTMDAAEESAINKMLWLC